jgi:hypothetical protein
MFDYMAQIRIAPAWREHMDRIVTGTLTDLDAQLRDDDYDPEDDLVRDDDFETPSGEPYDGCPTCLQRETMWITAALVLEGARQGHIELTAPILQLRAAYQPAASSSASSARPPLPRDLPLSHVGNIDTDFD